MTSRPGAEGAAVAVAVTGRGSRPGAGFDGGLETRLRRRIDDVLEQRDAALRQLSYARGEARDLRRRLKMTTASRDRWREQARGQR